MTLNIVDASFSGQVRIELSKRREHAADGCGNRKGRELIYTKARVILDTDADDTGDLSFTLRLGRTGCETS